MEYKGIRYEVAEGIATLTLNRPESYNALNMGTVKELIAAFAAIATDSEVKVVVIAAEGKAFCAGGDVKEFRTTMDRTATQYYQDILVYGDLFRAIITLPKPVVSVVDGIAVGAGANVALAADIVLASEKAKFSQIFTNIGLVPDTGGAYLLPRIVGRARAMELFLSHRMLGVEEAYSMGLVSRVIPSESLAEEALSYAKELAAGPTIAYGLCKKMVNQSLDGDLDAALDLEAHCQAIASTTADFREGVAAVLEKRSPNFTGK